MLRSIKTLIPLVLITLSACSGSQTEAANPTLVQRNGTPKVTLAKAEPSAYQTSIRANGTLMPQNHTNLTALSAGRLDRLNADIGQPVKGGELLFEVRTIDYELQRRQTQAALKQAEASNRIAKRESERLENLFKAGSATEQQLDQTRARADQAAAGLMQAQAAHQTAQQALNDCSIKAPYDGIITAKHVQPGEFVSPGMPVLEIMDLSVLNAELELPEQYAGQIRELLPVTIKTSTGVTRQGRIAAINPKIDMQNRTFLVKVAVDNADGKLQAGLFCSADFRLPAQENTIAVPSSAVIRDQGRSVVWIVKDGKASRRQITEVGSRDNLTWISEGLKADEMVVIKGTTALLDNMDVTIQ